MTLKSELDNFGGLFKQHLSGAMKATLRWVTADSVDWQNKTMTATDADDLPYYDVLLGVGTVSVKPSVKTDCLIAIVEGDDATAFLLYANEADLIEFNGGANSGLIKIVELESKLNELVNKFNNHVHSGVITEVTGGGGALAVGTPGNSDTPTSTADSFDKADFEDSKITH